MCEYKNQVWDLNSKLWRKPGLNTLKPCKMVKIWTLNGIITGLPQATELEQSSHEILDYTVDIRLLIFASWTFFNVLYVATESFYLYHIYFS